MMTVSIVRARAGGGEYRGWELDLLVSYNIPSEAVAGLQRQKVHIKSTTMYRYGEVCQEFNGNRDLYHRSDLSHGSVPNCLPGSGLRDSPTNQDLVH